MAALQLTGDKSFEMMNDMMAFTVDDIIYTLPVEPTLTVPAEIFGNRHPVELEIGTGKGGFLLEQARAHRDRNYLGLEWSNKYFRFAADRMARWHVDNVRMVRADAKLVVLRYLAPSCLAAIHVYHPDPWPKKRHHKRRLFDARFVQGLVQVLEDDARLMVQTDHEAYFRHIDGLLCACRELEQTLRVTQNGEDEAPPVSTNYQTKYAREGRQFYRLEYHRLPRHRALCAPAGSCD